MTDQCQFAQDASRTGGVGADAISPDSPDAAAAIDGLTPLMVATRLCILLTCFNRVEQTLACLQAVQASTGLEGVELNAVLLDDGSRDGTADAVRARFPWVMVLTNGGPPLFWCRGMHRAFATAIAQGHDHYLLLNDDTILLPDALARLLACAAGLRAQSPEAVPVLVVGSTQDASSGHHTYGGERMPAPQRPTTFKLLTPSVEPQSIDTFNGNIVLLPADVVALVGTVDPVYEHAMGDIDYGLRARAAGVAQWLAPGYHGTCSNNPVDNTFSDPALAWRKRWAHILSRKGLPWRSWLHFTRRHTGWRWPLFFMWPYVRLVAQGLSQSPWR